MADPRNPLIIGVTNDAGERGVNKLPTSYAVNQLFSGKTLAANTNVDNVIECGNYRFIASSTSLPSHLLGTTGILTVLHDRPSIPNGVFGGAEPTGGNPTVVRQIAWPDGPNDVTPYTRTKVGSTWGEWVTMGGNLRRVRLTANTTAQTNVMYYSFGNFTLTLPAPGDYPLGTRIGLEQYAGTGTVKWVNGTTTYTQGTTPAYAANEHGNPDTSNILGPNVYHFEIVEDSAVGSRIWLLDVDNDLAQTITDIRSNIELERSQRITAVSDEAANRVAADGVLQGNIDTLESKVNTTLGMTVVNPLPSGTKNIVTRITDEASARSSRDSELTTLINNETTARTNADKNKERLSKVYTYNGTVTTFKDGNENPLTIAELLKVVNPTFVITASGKTLALPAAAAAYNGCHVNVEVPGANHTVTVTAGSVSEAFTNTTGATLLLPFECVMNTSGGYIWNLLVIA